MTREQVQEALQRISIELIQAHRNARHEVLRRLARQAGLSEADCPAQPAKLFMKLIQIYHPDRTAAMMERFQRCRQNDDQAGLAALRSQLLPLAAAQGAAAMTLDLEPEFAVQPGDFGFGEHGWSDHLDGSRLRTERRPRQARTIDFLEALRREFFGNLELRLSRLELEELDGELELVDHGIGDLTGIQFCRNLTGLNLALNQIHDLAPLRRLRRLETLDLSSNQIEDADELEELRRLQELDLSDNQISDIAFLLALPRLSVVNLQGNPIRDHRIIDSLRANGVLVV